MDHEEIRKLREEKIVLERAYNKLVQSNNGLASQYVELRKMINSIQETIDYELEQALE